MKFYLVLVTLFVGYISAEVLRPPVDPLLKLLPLPIKSTQYMKGRITNGEVAQAGQFPYQVFLRLRRLLTSHACGGSIISDRYILTAAHCMQDVLDGTVYLGAFDLENENEDHRLEIDITNDNIITHGDWSALTLRNDIALIKLPSAVQFTDYIKPVTLPKFTGPHSTYDNETVVASGWGIIKDGDTKVTRYLRYIEVSIFPNPSCKWYVFGALTDDMMCIKTQGGKSTCSGDSGGPLVYVDNNVNYLVGITSFGISFGCQIGFPAVFTRTTSYLSWIKEKSGVSNS